VFSELRIPAGISAQLSQARDVIERHLAPTLLAVYLYGSALDGGLKPHSDIDLLVAVAARLDEAARRALLLDLLEVSAPPGQSEAFRALEVTVLVRSDVVPWHHPARRELQFGEWLRQDILASVFAPAVIDTDLAILLTTARQRSMALAGPSVENLFDPVPESDLCRALADTLEQWNASSDWAGNERNVALTLARIWYSAASGKIAPKDFAADWAMARLPAEHRPVLLEARQAYLGYGEDRLAARADRLTGFVPFMKREIANCLARVDSGG
jgi:predicted nucleotidyltransferase